MHGQCPICDANINIAQKVEISEVITCSDCKNKLEVKELHSTNMILIEAPKIEEDWGE